MKQTQPEDQRAVQEERQELHQRITDWLDLPLALLAFVMLGLLLLELTVQLDPDWARRVSQAQTAIWVIFVAAFLLEFSLAPSKVRYLRHNWLTAISVALPALRSVRLLRFARALRGLSLVRIMTTLNRGTRALGEVVSRGQLGYVALLTLVVTLTAAAGAFYFEQGQPEATITSPSQALWWAATIVTTINSPLETVTLEGQIIGLLLRVFALAVSGYVTAIIAAHLIGRPPTATPNLDPVEIQRLRQEIARLEEALERRALAEREAARVGGSSQST